MGDRAKTSADEWRKRTIGELCDAGIAELQTGPFGSQLHAHDYVEMGVPVVPTEGIRARRIDHSVLPKIAEEKAHELKRHRLVLGDILFARRGVQATGHVAQVRREEEGFICGTGAIRLRVRPKNDVIASDFLSHVLADPASVEWFKFHAIGATMPNLNEGIIRSFPFRAPTLDHQRAIAGFLGALDDKIELNRRMNETLEAMARALFKSWFVDFDPIRARAQGSKPVGMDPDTAKLFPKEFIDSDLGEIPKGWRAAPLYEIATYINGAAYKAFEPNDERRGLPIIKIAELKAGVTDQTKFSDVDMPEKYRIDSGDILFSWSGNPDTSIDTFVWCEGPAWLNQHIFRVVPHRQEERAFVLSTLKHLRPVFAEIARNKQTTGLGHVTAEDMKRLLVVCPDDGALLGWTQAVGRIWDRVFANEVENRILAKLRDALLPKLLAGQLTVAPTGRTVEDRCR